MKLIKCVKCDFHMFRKGPDGKWRLSCLVTIFEPGKPLRVVCRKCNKEQDFPADLVFPSEEKVDNSAGKPFLSIKKKMATVDGENESS